MTIANSTSTDPELLDHLREDAESALLLIHQRHVRAVFRCSRRVLSDFGAADEATQDTFLLLWGKRKSVVIYGESLLPWLLTTARYLSLNRARKLHRQQRKEEPLDEQRSGGEDPLAAVEALEQSAELREAVASLNGVDRRIVTMCFVHGLTYKEAAARLGLSHSSVRNRLSRARAHLRRDIESRHEGSSS